MGRVCVGRRPNEATVRVLVTGATSLLGGAMVERLSKRGDEVTVFQRGHSGLAVSEVRGDVASTDDVQRAVEGQQAVVHLAAKVAAIGPWVDFERVNVSGTATLIAAAQGAGVGRFVHVSSPSVAHDGKALVGVGPQTANPGATRGHYSTSKAQAELLALGASSSVMPVVAIRPHLVWGPGDEQLIGRIVDRARANRLALVGSGSALMDSTYVDNAAGALVAALDAAPRLGGRALVVSNGQPRTVRELIGRIVTAAGFEPPRWSVPTTLAFGGGLLIERIWDRLARTDDPPMTSFLAEQLSTAHWFEQRETRSLLGWVPEVGLDEGFERLAAWYRVGR